MYLSSKIENILILKYSSEICTMMIKQNNKEVMIIEMNLELKTDNRVQEKDNKQQVFFNLMNCFLF